MNRYRACLSLALALVLVATGCGGGGDGNAPEPTATFAPPGPTLPPVPTREPVPTSTPVATHPKGTRTGIAVIDDVLAAIEAGDAASLEMQLSFHPYRCDKAPAGTLGSNPCPPGVAEGSAVDVIALGGCEVSYLAEGRANLREELDRFAAAAALQAVYAITEVQEGRLASPLPLRYLVILSGSYTLLLDDAGITHLGLPCSDVGPAQLYHPADRAILAPL